MPVEIRELVIQACLDDSKADTTGKTAAAAPGSTDALEAKFNTLEQEVNSQLDSIRQEIMRECLELVMEQLEEKNISPRLS